MKTSTSVKASRPAFTLVELSLVIGLLIAMLSTGFYFSTAISDWKKGREASEILRSAYVAQRTYLADYPSTDVSTLTRAQLLQYVPNAPTSFPTVKALDDSVLQVNVSVSPPVVDSGDGSAYDPSGDPGDSLWDVGE
jgi:type II secretory pathway pseudopilin PulG